MDLTTAVPPSLADPLRGGSRSRPQDNGRTGDGIFCHPLEPLSERRFHRFNVCILVGKVIAEHG
jgi:hypothetical protein